MTSQQKKIDETLKNTTIGEIRLFFSLDKNLCVPGDCFFVPSSDPDFHSLSAWAKKLDLHPWIWGAIATDNFTAAIWFTNKQIWATKFKEPQSKEAVYVRIK